MTLRKALSGPEYPSTLIAAANLVASLLKMKLLEEGLTLANEWIPIARRALGNEDYNTLRLRVYGAIILRAVAKSTDDQREAAKLLGDLDRTLRRVMGDAHPLTMQVARILPVARVIGVKIELK